MPGKDEAPIDQTEVQEAGSDPTAATDGSPSGGDSLIGRTVHHYRILEKLGEGGMGEVYAAEDTKLKRRVAIKVLSGGFAAGEGGERLKRFHREAQAVAALNHPNIVTIYSVEELDDERFLTMEVVDGKTLDQVTPRGGMKLDRFFDLAIPMAEALGAAHEKGITHRDLKPGNIMVTADGRVKILDFGLAKLQQPDDSNHSLNTTTQALTQEGSILGTVAFMSPEQLQGNSPDSRSDIFSLGIVLYQMATGERPFEGASPADLISCILRDDPPPVSDLKVSLPNHLGRILKRCLEKDPDRRYQKALSVADDLRELRKELDSGSLQTTATRRPQDRRQSFPWRWVAVAALLLGAGIAAWGFLSQHSPLPDGDPDDPAGLVKAMIEIGALENLGPAEAEPFVLGLSDEVAAALSDMDGLGVLLGDGDQDPEASPAPPLADYLLSGAVQWGEKDAAGRRLRITFELTRKSDGLLVWSERYDRESSDLFRTQTDIANLLMRKVALSVLDYEMADLDLDLGEFQPPPQATESKPDPSPRRAATAAAKPEAPAGKSPEPVVEPVTKRVSEAPPSGKVELRIVLITFKHRGVLTLFQEEDKILQEPFRFRSKDEPPYSVEVTTEVDAAARQLRVYVAPKGQPAELVVVEPAFSGPGRAVLHLELRDSGSLLAELSNLD